MARYRKIDPRIWNDVKFRTLSDGANLAFLFLLTHPHMTSLGAMRGTVGGLAEELGWTAEAFREAFREALAKGMAEHDAEARMIALPNFIRYNPPESPNVIKAWLGSLDLLPECSLKTRVVERAKAFAEALGEAFAKALPEAFAKGMPYQEQEQEQEPEQEPEQEGGPVPDGTGCRQPAADNANADTKKRESCPYQQIINAYHEHFPSGPQVSKLTDKRKRSIAARWNEVRKGEYRPAGQSPTPRDAGKALQFFQRYFAYCESQPWCTGREPMKDGKFFRATIDNLVGAEFMAKRSDAAHDAREAA